MGRRESLAAGAGQARGAWRKSGRRGAAKSGKIIPSPSVDFELLKSVMSRCVAITLGPSSATAVAAPAPAARASAVCT